MTLQALTCQVTLLRLLLQGWGGTKLWLMKKTELAMQIRQMREERGWTQAELADRIEVSRPYVSQWETGAREVTAKHREALAREFGVDPGLFASDVAYVRTQADLSNWLLQMADDAALHDLAKPVLLHMAAKARRAVTIEDYESMTFHGDLDTLRGIIGSIGGSDLAVAGWKHALDSSYVTAHPEVGRLIHLCFPPASQ